MYLRNITEAMDKTKIAEAFEAFGPVLHVDVPPGKKIAFVTFKSAETAALTIGKSVTINGEQVLAEERRRSIARTDKKFAQAGDKPFKDNNGYNRNSRQSKTNSNSHKQPQQKN